ncbi:MAG: hypothetical protein ACRDRS_26475 [Pseudonocardiaceae bacterium]
MVTDEASGIAELDLDITVVEAGDAVEALLDDTDNGCNTRKDGDC